MKKALLALLLALSAAQVQAAAKDQFKYEPERGAQLASLRSSRLLVAQSVKAATLLSLPLLDIKCAAPLVNSGCGGSGGGGGLTSGSSTLTGFVDGDILYNNGGVIGGFQLYDDTGAGSNTLRIRKTATGATQGVLELRRSPDTFGSSPEVFFTDGADLTSLGYVAGYGTAVLQADNATNRTLFGSAGGILRLIADTNGMDFYSNFSSGTGNYNFRFGSAATNWLRISNQTANGVVEITNSTNAQDIFRLYDNTTLAHQTIDGGAAGWAAGGQTAAQDLGVSEFGFITSRASNYAVLGLRNQNTAGISGLWMRDAAAATGAYVGFFNSTTTTTGIPVSSLGLVTTGAFPVVTATNSIQRDYIEDAEKTVTDNTVTTIFTVTTGNDIQCSGTAFFSARADDNTNDGRQTTRAAVHFTAVDKTAGAGGEACNVGLVGTNVTSLSPTNGGTILTVTTAATTGTDLCNVRLTVDSDLAVVTAINVRYRVVMDPGSSTCVITPQ